MTSRGWMRIRSMAVWQLRNPGLLRTTLLAGAALAICLVAGAAQADDDGASADIPREFRNVTSYIESGLIFNSDDSFKFGDYTGTDEKGLYLLGNMDLQGRTEFDSATPKYWRFKASNVGLDSRIIGLEYGRQGRFWIDLDYNELPKLQSDSGRYFLTNEGGTTMLTPPGWVASDTTAGMTGLAGPLPDLELEHQRERLGGGITLFPTEDWKLRARFDRETKKGTKLTSALIASSGGNPRAVLAPEPIDYDTRMLDVGLEYGNARAQFKLDYHFSGFSNRDDSLTWQNPFLNPSRPWDPNAAYPTGFGRKSLPPDNRFDQVTFMGGYNLSDQTRLTLNGAFGRMAQDESFLPYSYNPDYVTTPLPRNSLDGEIYTTLVNLGISSRPLPKLTLNARYRFDDRDNKTPRNTYIYVPSDSTNQGAIDGSTARINHPYSYRENEVALDARYRLMKRTDLSLGYQFEQVERDYSEVDRLRDHKLGLKLRTQPMRGVSASFDVSGSRRKGSTYHHNEPYLTGHSPEYIALQSGVGLWENHPLLRRYYLADRERLEVGASASFMPLDTVTMSLSARHFDDDFEDTELGLTGRRTTSYTLDCSFAPWDGLEAYAFFTHENYVFDLDGWSFSGRNKGPDSTDPTRRWSSSNEDVVDTAGIGLRTNLIPDKLDLTADYLFSRSVEEDDANHGPALGAAARSFPDAISRLHNVRLGLEYRLRDNMTFRTEYSFEKYSQSDWSTDNVGLQTMAEVATIGDQLPDYKAHLISWSVVYNF